MLFSEFNFIKIIFIDLASPFMYGIIELHDHIFFFLNMISFIILFLIVTTTNSFFYLGDIQLNCYLITRAVKNKYDSLRLNHGTTIEIIWIIIPSFIFVLISTPVLIVLYATDGLIDPAITIEAINQQKSWSYINNYFIPDKITNSLLEFFKEVHQYYNINFDLDFYTTASKSSSLNNNLSEFNDCFYTKKSGINGTLLGSSSSKFSKPLIANTNTTLSGRPLFTLQSEPIFFNTKSIIEEGTFLKRSITLKNIKIDLTHKDNNYRPSNPNFHPIPAWELNDFFYGFLLTHKELVPYTAVPGESLKNLSLTADGKLISNIFVSAIDFQGMKEPQYLLPTIFKMHNNYMPTCLIDKGSLTQANLDFLNSANFKQAQSQVLALVQSSGYIYAINPISSKEA